MEMTIIQGVVGSENWIERALAWEPVFWAREEVGVRSVQVAAQYPSMRGRAQHMCIDLGRRLRLAAQP